ncbi:MAG: MBL fold metallo-hydrolase [Trueperaceae bacterium]|nr:MBL fold metallo-hydrolase [Trueperaceae bacterium]
MQTFSFKLADLSCASLPDNKGESDLKSIFPAATEAELGTALTEKLEVGFNCLYIRQGKTNILVDTGTGEGQLLAALAQLGLEAKDIDFVILTHGDRDHIGGVLEFPRARLIMSEKMLESWTDAEKQEQMVDEFIKLFQNKIAQEALASREQERRHFAQALLPQIKSRIQTVAFENEFLPGFKLIDASGHRTDHTALEISSEDQTLIHVVDSIRHPVQITYHWASFIDSYPDMVVETNKRLVERILAKDALIFGAHLPFPGLARLSRETSGLEWHWVK